MSGPIVRSAPSKKFSTNWDSVFGGKSAAAPQAKKSGKSASKKSAKKKKKR